MTTDSSSEQNRHNRHVSTGLIEIVRLEPERGTRLLAGSDVTIKARLRYKRVIGNRGRVTIIVQDHNGGKLLKEQPSVILERSEGEVELSAKFRVPEGASQVHVFFPLFVTERGPKGTDTVAHIKYDVEPCSPGFA